MSTTTTRLSVFDLVPDAKRASGPSRADLELLSVRGLPAELAGTEETLPPGASVVALVPTARPHALTESELRRPPADDRSARGPSLSSMRVSYRPVRSVMHSAQVGAGAR